METFINNFWPVALVPATILVRFGWEIGGAIWRTIWRKFGG